MKTSFKILLASAAIAVSAAAPASAATIVGLYNTGVDANGAVLTGANAVDTHYLVNGAPTFTTNNPAYVQSSTAKFIASGTNGSGGSKTYTLTFDLGTLKASTASLSGFTAYDNTVSILLNGNSIYSDVPASPGTYTAFNTLHAFSAGSSLFLTGVNTLTFTVLDYQAPTGLLVTGLTGTAMSAVPEPASWALMLAGFGMIGFAARRRTAVKTSVTYG